MALLRILKSCLIVYYFILQPRIINQLKLTRRLRSFLPIAGRAPESWGSLWTAAKILFDDIFYIFGDVYSKAFGMLHIYCCGSPSDIPLRSLPIRTRPRRTTSLPSEGRRRMDAGISIFLLYFDRKFHDENKTWTWHFFLQNFEWIKLFIHQRGNIASFLLNLPHSAAETDLNRHFISLFNMHYSHRNWGRSGQCFVRIDSLLLYRSTSDGRERGRAGGERGRTINRRMPTDATRRLDRISLNRWLAFDLQGRASIPYS